MWTRESHCWEPCAQHSLTGLSLEDESPQPPTGTTAPPLHPSLSPGYRPQAGLWPLPCMQHAGWFPQLSLPLLEEDRDLPGAFCLWPIILGPQAASEICSPDGRLYEAQLRLRVPRSAAWGAGRGLGAAQREGLLRGSNHA